MEENTIRKSLATIKTVKEFAVLLDEIKSAEFGFNKPTISEKQLYLFANSKKVANRYRTFQIKKKKGGYRIINAPCNQLKMILNIINLVLSSIYKPESPVMGFTKGRSIVDNAKIHVGHRYVFNIDLKDFFPSISQGRIWAVLQLPPFNFTKEIASVLAGLCCHLDEDRTKNVLPQGAPTSPLLTNTVCSKLDKRLMGLARRFGLHYTRYADDMTFSSMHNVYQEDGLFRSKLKEIIEEQGFVINEKKNRLFHDGMRQEVTGLTVNSEVNVSRKFISDIRYYLHIWESLGYAKAYSIFYTKYKYEKGYLKKGEPVMENVIAGKLNYIRMVKGNKNKKYQNLQARYEQLVGNTTYENKEKGYAYVISYSLPKFVDYFKTSISLIITERKNIVGKCVIGGKEMTISITKSIQNKLLPDIDKRIPGKHLPTNLIDNYFVTLCRSKGKNYWLVDQIEPSLFSKNEFSPSYSHRVCYDKKWRR